MTGARAGAYTRAMRTLRAAASGTLTDEQVALLRATADRRIFTEEGTSEWDELLAFAEVVSTIDELIASGRMTAIEGETLLDDLWAAGPVKIAYSIAA